ncbi:MAG: mechanosensitive ion channel family protein [Bacteriovoracaceae bacterium]
MNNLSVESVSSFFRGIWEVFSTPLFELSGNQISVFSIFAAIVFFYFSSVVSKYSQKITRRFLEGRPIDKGVKGSIVKIVGHVAQVIGILVALDMIGINLSSLVAIGGVLAVGIGFGLQNITQNFISGLIILFERPIKNGDLVEVDGVVGRVTEIGSRSTTVTTRDDVSIIVPNSKFISERVVNDSFSGERRRFRVSVGVAYGSEVEKVRSLLIEVASSHGKVLNSPRPEVFFQDFADSSLNFDLNVWIQDLWASEQILSDLRFSIDKAFRDGHVEIPFPQRDLHIKSSSVKF